MPERKERATAHKPRRSAATSRGSEVPSTEYRVPSDGNNSEPRARNSEHSYEWYAEGLRFNCTQCGNCCTGPPGAVWFTEDEGRAMADELGITEQQFYRRYAKRIGRKWSLTEVRTKHGYNCIFLDRKTMPGKAVCSIYSARPVQCRTWPFWPENLTSPETWAAVKRNTPCPGMDRGRVVPVEQIRIQRDSV